MKNLSGLVRGEYGQILSCNTKSYLNGKKILSAAQQMGLIDKPFNDTEYNARKGKRIGKMLNTNIYDVMPGAVLIQYRYITMHKYGTDVLKEYFLLTRKNGKITVDNRENDKHKIVKLSKSDLPLGGVIATITGKKNFKIKVKPSQMQSKKEGYKALQRDDEGNLVSVWDGSPWIIGKTRIEAATPNHDGGFYCYRTIEECINAAKNSDIFGSCRDHNNLVIVRVETRGKIYVHESEYGNKICTTSMKVVEIICEM